MSGRLLCIFVLALALGGCSERRKPARRVFTPDASGPSRSLARPVAAPRAVPHTAAQRAFDRAHRPALRRIVAELRLLFGHSLSLQARGVREPASRARWPQAREKLVADAGRLKAKILAVDPLSNRSWAAARARVLLRYLTVKLPDAIRESWRMRPSGAFATWKSDFRLIWGRLQRYVDHQLQKQRGPRPKDSQ